MDHKESSNTISPKTNLNKPDKPNKIVLHIASKESTTLTTSASVTQRKTKGLSHGQNFQPRQSNINRIMCSCASLNPKEENTWQLVAYGPTHAPPCFQLIASSDTKESRKGNFIIEVNRLPLKVEKEQINFIITPRNIDSSLGKKDKSEPMPQSGVNQKEMPGLLSKTIVPQEGKSRPLSQRDGSEQGNAGVLPQINVPQHVKSNPLSQNGRPQQEKLEHLPQSSLLQREAKELLSKKDVPSQAISKPLSQVGVPQRGTSEILLPRSVQQQEEYDILSHEDFNQHEISKFQDNSYLSEGFRTTEERRKIKINQNLPTKKDDVHCILCRQENEMAIKSGSLICPCMVLKNATHHEKEKFDKMRRVTRRKRTISSNGTTCLKANDVNEARNLKKTQKKNGTGAVLNFNDNRLMQKSGALVPCLLRFFKGGKTMEMACNCAHNRGSTITKKSLTAQNGVVSPCSSACMSISKGKEEYAPRKFPLFRNTFFKSFASNPNKSSKMFHTSISKYNKDSVPFPLDFTLRSLASKGQETLKSSQLIPYGSLYGSEETDTTLIFNSYSNTLYWGDQDAAAETIKQTSTALSLVSPPSYDLKYYSKSESDVFILPDKVTKRKSSNKSGPDGVILPDKVTNKKSSNKSGSDGFNLPNKGTDSIRKMASDSIAKCNDKTIVRPSALFPPPKEGLFLSGHVNDRCKKKVRVSIAKCSDKTIVKPSALYSSPKEEIYDFKYYTGLLLSDQAKDSIEKTSCERKKRLLTKDLSNFYKTNIHPSVEVNNTLLYIQKKEIKTPKEKQTQTAHLTSGVPNPSLDLMKVSMTKMSAPARQMPSGRGKNKNSNVSIQTIQDEKLSPYMQWSERTGPSEAYRMHQVSNKSREFASSQSIRPLVVSKMSEAESSSPILEPPVSGNAQKTRHYAVYPRLHQKENELPLNIEEESSNAPKIIKAINKQNKNQSEGIFKKVTPLVVEEEGQNKLSNDDSLRECSSCEPIYDQYFPISLNDAKASSAEKRSVAMRYTNNTNVDSSGKFFYEHQGQDGSHHSSNYSEMFEEEETKSRTTETLDLPLTERERSMQKELPQINPNYTWIADNLSAKDRALFITHEEKRYTNVEKESISSYSTRFLSKDERYTALESADKNPSDSTDTPPSSKVSKLKEAPDLKGDLKDKKSSSLTQNAGPTSTLEVNSEEKGIKRTSVKFLKEGLRRFAHDSNSLAVKQESQEINHKIEPSTSFVDADGKNEKDDKGKKLSSSEADMLRKSIENFTGKKDKVLMETSRESKFLNPLFIGFGCQSQEKGISRKVEICPHLLCPVLGALKCHRTCLKKANF